MRIGALVNDIATERSSYTTVALARSARARGHSVHLFGVSDFVYENGHVSAWASEAADPMDTADAFLAALRSPDAPPRRVTIDDFDVLLLRNNPAEEPLERPWATQVGLIFGEQALQRGVLVLNHPCGLSRALSKLYLERFPAAIRPASLVTRHAEDVRAFLSQYPMAVVKPLSGFGGKSVFVLRAEDSDNFNQIVEAVGEHGYLTVQEYLPEARRGDIRMLLLNGRPLEHEGRVAAVRRVAPKGELRNNVKVGGHVEAVEVTDAMRRLAEMARPQLTADGMFLVGLDLVGDKVMEVNVFSPGGIVGATMLYGIDYAAMVIADLERKVVHARSGIYDRNLLACL